MIDFEQFSKGSSVIHNLDPRARIIPAAVFTLFVALAARPVVLLCSLALAILLVALAGLDTRAVGRRLMVINGFIFLLWLTIPFSYPGKTLFTFGLLDVSREGIIYAAVITLKANTIALAIMALLSTIPVFALAHGLRHLRVPEKLVQIFFFTFRYFFVIYKEYNRLRQAMRIRCFKLGTNRHTYKSIAYLIGMLLVRSLDRSDRVYKAMLLRGFDGKFWVYKHFSFQGKDAVFMAVSIITVLFLGVIEWMIPV